MDRYELPEGWEWRNLGGVEGLKAACEFLDRLRVPVNAKERAKRQGPYPYYGANGRQGWIDDYIFDEELVLLAEDGGFFFDPTKPTAYRVSGKCWVNNHAHVLRPVHDINPDWLCACLAFTDYTPFIPEPIRPKLNQKNAKRIPIPVPPLSEQRRIVSRIEQLTARLEKARALQKQAVEEAENLFSSVISKYLTSDGWESKCLSEVRGRLGLFTDGDWIVSKNMDSNGNVRLLQLADIGIGAFLDKSAKFISEEKFNELGCTEVKPGDVLISRMADPIARACVVPPLTQKMIAAVDIAIVRVDPKIANAKFVTMLCNSGIVKEQANSFARGSTRKRISRKDLEKIKVPLPPLSEQKRIVAKIEQSQTKAEQLKQLQAETEAELEKFLPALLAKAFRGEL
ncbi:MAG: restriction endonuclease subunit S [Planctomycetota bacterium]|nr:restriction endonuclease subunit S [Planctomycetota bacterium]